MKGEENDIEKAKEKQWEKMQNIPYENIIEKFENQKIETKNYTKTDQKKDENNTHNKRNEQGKQQSIW